MTPTEIYASNHAVSAASDQMAEHIDKLRQAGLIDAVQAKHRIASVEEIRALTSADVALNIVDSELRSARTAEKSKRAIERKWKEGEPKKISVPKAPKDVVLGEEGKEKQKRGRQREKRPK